MNPFEKLKAGLDNFSGTVELLFGSVHLRWTFQTADAADHKEIVDLYEQRFRAAGARDLTRGRILYDPNGPWRGSRFRFVMDSPSGPVWQRADVTTCVPAGQTAMVITVMVAACPDNPTSRAHAEERIITAVSCVEKMVGFTAGDLMEKPPGGMVS